MFGAIVTAVLSLVATRLREPRHYVIYPVALLSLLPSWQIEPRYALCALVLFLLFRVQQVRSVEWGLAAYLAALSLVLAGGVARGTWFV